MRVVHLLLLGLCLILFITSATTDLALPGFHEDESYYACLAIDLMQPIHPLSKAYRIHLGRQPFPFGICPHAGALEAYLLWPLFSLFGPSVALQRMYTLFVGLLVLLFCYLFLLGHVGRWGAFFATLLLSLDTSFIFYSKLDAGPIVESLLWMVVALWAFGRWVQTHRLRHLIVGLLAGIFGIYNYITYIWFMVASITTAFLLYRRDFFRLFKKPAVYFVIPGALCFLVIFVYWLLGDRAYLFRRPPGFPGAFVMFERLSILGGIIPDILLGRYSKLVPTLKVRPPTDIFLIVSALFIGCCGKRSKFIYFLFFIAGIIFLEISWTPGDFVYLPHRMMVFYLFLIFFGGLAIAQSLQLLKDYKSQRLWLKVASSGILLLALLSVSGQILLKQEADQKIRQTGGKGPWSDAIYRVAYFVEEGEWEKAVCLDWELRRPLFLLTKGKVHLTAPFMLLNVNRMRKRQMWAQLIQEASPHTLFLIYPEQSEGDGTDIQDFRKTAQQIGKELKLEQVFYEREGDPRYFAYTVRRGEP